MDAKLWYIWALQQLHNKIDFSATPQISSLFLEKPKRRADAAAKNKVSLLDFADLPKNTPDEKIIKLIASEMSKSKELKMKLSQRKTYSNEFLMFDPDKGDLLGLSHSAIEKFNALLQQELIKYQQSTGKIIPEKFYKIHNSSQPGTIHLKSTEEILCFIRKDFITNHAELEKEECIAYKLLVCRILKRMLAVEDYNQHKEAIDRSRKVFDTFVTTELTKTFYHMALDKSKDLIEDKSHANYFSDKLYRLPRKHMRDMGISYSHDIHFRITKRSKSENSIINKTIFDPKLNSAEAAKDIWGIRFLNIDGDPEREVEESNILRYYMTLLYNKNQFASNEDLDNAFPQWHSINDIGKEYTPEDIASMINFMHMDMKDKDILKIKIVREKSEISPPLYELDKDFFACYGCDDPYVLAQMNAIVDKKNQDAKHAFDISKKSKSEAKFDVFKELVKDGLSIYEAFLEDEKSLQILYWCEKKVLHIKKKFQALEKILSLQKQIGTAPKRKQKILDWNGVTFSYIDEAGIDRKITVDPSKIEVFNETAYYKHDEAIWFYIEIAQHKISFSDLEILDKEFLAKRKESPQNQDNKDKWERKWSGSSSWIDGKDQGRLYTQNGQYFLWEHQFMPERAIKNIKPMTVSEIYQYVKDVFVTLRLEHLITREEISTMIWECLVPTLNAKPQVENLMTWKQLLEAIVQDDTALPPEWGIEEKFMHELENDRDVKPFIFNGKKIDGVYIYPEFAKRTKRHKLGIDSVVLP